MPNLSPSPHRLFGALGDPTRLAVIQQLCRRPESVSRLASRHRMALPSFMQHLRVLEAAGWVRTRKEGRVRTCEIDPTALQASVSWLETQRTLWETRLDQLDDYLLSLHESAAPEHTDPS